MIDISQNFNFFRTVFRFMAKLTGECRGCPHEPPPHIPTASPMADTPRWRATFTPSDGIALTRPCHPKPTVYPTVHGWCHASYGFGQVHYDMCTVITQSVFTALKSSAFYLLTLPLPRPLAVTDLFTMSMVSPFA